MERTTGPMWHLYEDLVVGRILRHPSDGRQGVIMFPKHYKFDSNIPSSFYLVRWGQSGPEGAVEEVPSGEVEHWLTDEFADLPCVPPALLELQKTGWAVPQDASFQPRVPSSTPAQDQGAPRQEPGGPSAAATAATAAATAATATGTELPVSSGSLADSPGSSTRKDGAGGSPARDAGTGAAPTNAGHPSLPATDAVGQSEAMVSDDDGDADYEHVMRKDVPPHQPATAQEPLVLCPATSRWLPYGQCIGAGDKRIDEIPPEDLDGEFVVERIMDEMFKNDTMWYLVKWQGYELNVGTSDKPKGDWEPEMHLINDPALEDWRKAKPDWWLEQQGPQYGTSAPAGREVTRPEATDTLVGSRRS